MTNEKNLWVIPTDKPSRLFKTHRLVLVMYNPPISCKTAQNIYITSDEDLKAGDYVYSTSQNYNIQKVSKVLEKSYNDTEHYKKIILTTDQDLIKDGVQAIDDEFLEWFVKNTSCEFIEVKELLSNNGNAFYGYRIIIPKEEPKTGSITECIKMIIDNQLNELEEPKQDTFITAVDGDGEWLSPVATERVWQEEQLANIFEHYPNASPKWQYMNGLIQNSLDAKKMFSEEEVRRIAKWSFYFHKTNDFSDSELADEWELRLEKMFKNK
jgi:hypothetical protein